MKDIPVEAYDAAVAAIRSSLCACVDPDPSTPGCPACDARAALAAAAPMLRAQGAHAERQRRDGLGAPNGEVVEGLFRLLETAERRVDEYGRALVALGDVLAREHARRCHGDPNCSVCHLLMMLHPETGADTNVRMKVVELADRSRRGPGG